MVSEDPRKHEVQFCAEVSKWADRLFAERTALPFGSSDIESFGRGSNKRQDLRFYGRKDSGRGKLALCGEVKLPGTAQGRSPFDVSLMQDAFDKATRENCRYFFTWNVEEIALFDRSRWDAETMHERCIGQWKLGLELNKPVDVTRAEVGLKIQNDLLPRFFDDFAEGGYPLNSPSPHRLWFAFRLPEVRVNYPVMGNRIDGHSLLRQAQEKFASTL